MKAMTTYAEEKRDLLAVTIFDHIGAIIFFRYFLQFAKNIAIIYTNFCNPQNISQIFAQNISQIFALCKIYRKYLRKTYREYLRSAKNTAICFAFFCALQNVSQIFAVFFIPTYKYRW